MSSSGTSAMDSPWSRVLIAALVACFCCSPSGADRKFGKYDPSRPTHTHSSHPNVSVLILHRLFRSSRHSFNDATRLPSVLPPLLLLPLPLLDPSSKTRTRRKSYIMRACVSRCVFVVCVQLVIGLCSSYYYFLFVFYYTQYHYYYHFITI